MREWMKIAGLPLVLTLASGIAPAAETPLEAFGTLVVGEWETEDSRHVFEWGVARKVVRSRSYFKVEREWTLVSEGLWFWDARQEQVRGVAVATGMPVELFEYRSKIREKEVVHELDAQGPAGGKFVERWKFGGGEYHWTLENPQGGEPIMGATYRLAD
jgi:hypothetical protein